MRWRAFRPALDPPPESLGAPRLIEAATSTAEHRAAAREAAAWLLSHTDVPTVEVLDAYLDAVGLTPMLDVDEVLALREAWTGAPS
jgi:hypothetical protein